MPHREIPQSQRANAKRMRKDMTEAERRLWNQLRAHRLNGLGFRRQMPIENYIADFACAELKLVVEVDGVQHAMPERAERDRIRTNKLGETGWTVIRFWNDEVMNDLDNVCDHIVLLAEQMKPHPPLSPSVTSPPQGGRMEQAGFSGGCQCGAVRYSCESLGRPSICHCRMCQKAFGGFYGPLVTGKGLKWTRGEPTYFQSSSKVRRGFCNACGTPLIYDYGGVPEIAIGSLDNPELAAPVIQVNPAEKLTFVDGLSALPVREFEEGSDQAKFMTDLESFQHPDHDTDAWPLEKDQ